MRARRPGLALAVTLGVAVMSYAFAGAQEAPDAGAQKATDGRAAAITGESRPEEVLFARRILMDAIGRNNDWLHDSVDGHFAWDPTAVRARLDAISVMLLAFPHLYHPATDIWSEQAEAEDASAVSLTLPAAWDGFEAFYAMAESASETALAASLATEDEEVVLLIEELEGQCESCHAAFRQPRTSGREDLGSGG